MNNAYYSNPYKRKAKTPYLKKLSMQLSIVLMILLVLMLLKYTSGKFFEGINEKLKSTFYSDMTNKTEDVFKNMNPNFNEKIKKIFNKPENSSFKIDFLPVDGIVTCEYGKRINPVTNNEEIHTGIDIDSPEGKNVEAVYDGVIEKVMEDDKFLGTAIVIKHNDEFETIYGHLSKVNVTEGQNIKTKDVIGLSGNTGVSTAPHLHFEVHKNGEPVNPVDYLTNK